MDFKEWWAKQTLDFPSLEHLEDLLEAVAEMAWNAAKKLKNTTDR